MNDLDEMAAWSRENRRAAFWRGVVIGAAVMLLLTTCVGCAAPTLLTEVEHVSHPLAGWPVEKQHEYGVALTQYVGPSVYQVSTYRMNREDELTQLNALLHWEGAGWYADAGLGYKLHGRNGGGFYGPAMTGTVRVGKEWRIFR